MYNIFKKKEFDLVVNSTKTSKLKKTLGPFDLILFGLGAIIGTGVFVLTGVVAAQHAGPAICLAYAIAGITCIFVALSYTELANMIPASGSIYTYSYVAFGEMFAWLMAGAIVLELGFSAATVAVGWSSYVQGLLNSAGIFLPAHLSSCSLDGGLINLPALCIVLLVSTALYFGTKESKKLNTCLVLMKIAVIFLFIFYAVPHFKISNFNDFMPKGFEEVKVGASILFFAFGGFNILTTAAEECKNPTRDLQIGIIGSLVLATLVYVIVSACLVGMMPNDNISQLDNPRALALALEIHNNHVGSAIIATGIVCGMTTVIMMNIYGQSRIFYAICRDGLLPQSFAKLHPKYNSPYVILMLFALFIALLSAFIPCKTLAQLSSMGGLIDYFIASFIVIMLRIKLPNAHRPFKCPWVYLVSAIALLSCGHLLYKQIFKDGVFLDVGWSLIAWFGIVLILYFIRIIFISINKNNLAK